MPTKRSGTSNQPVGKLPPIAPREEQDSFVSEASSSFSSAAELPKHRLPPRSRNGCWTCRVQLPWVAGLSKETWLLPHTCGLTLPSQTRKVKCGEEKPSCTQCTRLGHICDYSPKVAFKDETPKIVQKYVGSTPASHAWPAPAGLSLQGQHTPHRGDDLPPFNVLANDEDWQRKAEHQPPGTFFVVANSASFADVDEYKDSHLDGGNRGKYTHDPGEDKQNVIVDPSTVILGTFEDVPRRQALSLATDRVKDPSSASSAPQAATPLVVIHRLNQMQVSSVQSANEPSVNLQGHPEPLFTQNYRTIVRHHVFQKYHSPAIGGDDVKDILELEAEQYPPLHHAIMALSGLSVSARDTIRSVDAIQHYQQALVPLQNMRQEEDLASNGAFFTHFILLLYEIASTDTECFWSYHMSSLLRIVRLRRGILEEEPYPSVIWLTCLIDLTALLSGNVRGGEFVSTLIREELVPSVNDLQKGWASPGIQVHQDRSHNTLVNAAFSLQREVVLIAVNIGCLRNQIEEAVSQQHGEEDPALRQRWQAATGRYRGLLKHTWNTMMNPELASFVDSESHSSKIGSLVHTTRLIFNVCLIYTCGMMWPSQRLAFHGESKNDITSAITEILALATNMIEAGQLWLRALVFPLLLAGVFQEHASEKMKVQDLLQALELESIGVNTRATRHLLEAIYEGQNRSLMAVGHSMDVDYVGMIRNQQIVHCGL